MWSAMWRYTVPWLVVIVSLWWSAPLALAWEPVVAPTFGGCPKIHAQENVTSHIDQLQGRWYVQLLSAAPDRTARCMELHLQYNQSAQTVTVLMNQLMEDGGESRIRSPTSVIANTTRGQLIFGKGGDEDYFAVLGTDFQNYTVLHACKTAQNKVEKHIAYTWFLSRNMSLSAEESTEFDDKIQKVINNNPLERDQLQRFNQTSCQPSTPP